MSTISRPEPAMSASQRVTKYAKQTLLRLYELGGRAYLTPMLRREVGEGLTVEISEGALSYATMLRALNDHGRREVLDVGTGLVAWPRLLADCGFHVVAIDKYDAEGYWGRRPFNRHYLVDEDDITQPRLQGQFDAITCVHAMMSIPDDSAAVAGMFKLTRPGGLVAMSFPYNEHRSVANVYELPDAGYGQDFRFKCRLYSRADIDRWISEQQAELVLQERYRVFSGELWTMGHRVVPTVTGPDEPHHFTTVVLRKPPAAQPADAPS